MKNILSVLLSVAVLSGCARYPSTEVKLDKGALDNKAIVVTSVGHQYESWLTGKRTAGAL